MNMWYAQSVFSRNRKLIEFRDSSYRRFLFAIILSFCPGLGQVYSGYLVRGIIGFLGLILISWLCAVLFIKVDSRLLSVVFLFIPFIYAFALCIDAAFSAIKKSSGNKINTINSRRFQIAGFIVLFIVTNILMDNMVGKHIVRAYFVTTGSMMPTILQHDLILIDKLSSPEVSNVVLLDFKKDKTSVSISSIITDKTLRRIIATEGDIVEIRGRDIFVNRKQMAEKYAVFGKSGSHNIYSSSNYQWGPETVPKGAYFVMADSRQYGFDSRSLGFINKNLVRGIASKVLWSWNLDEGFFKFGRTAIKIE